MDKLKWELESSWIFESTDDGKSLFYPRGWGPAYVVPNTQERDKIERFLAVWLARLRFAMRITRWLVLPVAVMAFAGLVPLFWYSTWYLRVWHVFVRPVLMLGGLGCLIMLASPIALRFVADLAKADLEKTEQWRPFAESLRDYARRTPRRRLWSEEVFYGFILLDGTWMLWPRRKSIMIPTHVNPHLFLLGISMIVVGGVMAVVKLWEIHANSKAKGSIFFSS